MPRVYLAGFDVFCRDAQVRGELLKAGCRACGLQGVYPLDDGPPADTVDQAAWICQANLDKIRCADAVLANLNSFRGAEPDSGTAFEVGYACALGKPVWAYFTDQRPLMKQLSHDDEGYCSEGFQIEDFGLPRNLMLACNWAGCSTDWETALAELARLLATAPAQPSEQVPARRVFFGS